MTLVNLEKGLDFISAQFTRESFINYVVPVIFDDMTGFSIAT